MSTYVISDLHGYAPEKFEALLRRAGFGDGDVLYIIGDVVDRNGDGGVELLRRIMERPNYEFILGNHEDMLLHCAFVFDEITDESLENLTADQTVWLERYLRNGGGVTLETLGKLAKKDRAAFCDLMDFLQNAPVYGAVTAGGRDYLLVHGGLPNFSPEKKLADYPVHGLLWERPRLETRYFDDITTVIGHTPTLYYGPEHEGKVLFTPTWICVDAGAAEGLAPALLRLDDLKVFYGEKQ